MEEQPLKNQTTLFDYAVCAQCGTTLPADDALWDEDDAYCSLEHLQLAEEDRLIRRYDFEDAIFGWKL